MKVGDFLFAGMFLFLSASSCPAQVPVCGDGVVSLRSVPGHMTDVVFEDGVADLVRSGDPATLKVEHTAGHLFITPLTINPAVLTVIDRRGRSHRIRHVFGGGVDEKIVVADCQERVGGKGHADVVMDFMRDLIRGRVPSGASESPTDEVMFEDGQWLMRATRIYQAPLLLGYAAVIRNKGSSASMAPVQRFSWPGLVAVMAEKDFLAPGDEGMIFMAVRR